MRSGVVEGLGIGDAAGLGDAVGAGEDAVLGLAECAAARRGVPSTAVGVGTLEEPATRTGAAQAAASRASPTAAAASVGPLLSSSARGPLGRLLVMSRDHGRREVKRP